MGLELEPAFTELARTDGVWSRASLEMMFKTHWTLVRRDEHTTTFAHMQSDRQASLRAVDGAVVEVFLTWAAQDTAVLAIELKAALLGARCDVTIDARPTMVTLRLERR